MQDLNRRGFLAALAAGGPTLAGQPAEGHADFTLRIGAVEVEIAPKRFVKTTGYNGSFPGPPLRLDEGQPVTAAVYNDTAIPELVHWHGLFLPPEVDGSAEEGTPFVPPHSRRTIAFTPEPAGTRWYHSHIYAGRDLHRATYTGQFGFLQIVPKSEPGRYDREVSLALHGWNPYLAPMGGPGEGSEGTLEVNYGAFTVNSHALGGGEPVRVKPGERVRFRILNANATMAHRLALAGHRFQVIALDGNPVPTPREVEVLELAAAERIDAIVEMNRPGVWTLGEVDEKMRKLGLGTVVEYAGRSGEPQWTAPPNEIWDYTQFGGSGMAPEPDERIPLVFKNKWAGNRWVDHWTINGKEYPKTDPIRVRTNGKYRLIFDNRSDDAHPIHLHRHSFELVRVAGKPTSGILKDVVNVQPRTQVEVHLVANHPGPSLFHCHMQIHMDYGFMTLLEYVDAPGTGMKHAHG
jgi:FtsP/CotA-like multicopper oxidase with cupredoxin domain